MSKEERIMVNGVRKWERIIWVSLVSVIVIISVFVIAKYQITLNQVNQKVTDLEGEKTTWTQSEANLTSQVSELKSQIQAKNELIKSFPTNNPDIINGLEQRGFNGRSAGNYCRPVKS